MFAFLRRPDPYRTPLAMIGAKAGDRVLVDGDTDPSLAAAIALVTGLNGQTVVLGSPGARPRIEAAAAKAGALVDFMTDGPMVPAAQPPFDVVVWLIGPGHRPAGQSGERASELVPALRPGGRLIVIERDPPRRALGGRPKPDPEAIIGLLVTAGVRAARVLGAADGVTYYEARRPADSR
jgi:hypothetical protein